MSDKDKIETTQTCATCLAFFGFGVLFVIILTGVYFAYGQLRQEFIFWVAVILSTLLVFWVCLKSAMAISKIVLSDKE